MRAWEPSIRAWRTMMLDWHDTVEAVATYLKENRMPLMPPALPSPIIPCSNCGLEVRYVLAERHTFVAYDAEKEAYRAGYVHSPMTCKPGKLLLDGSVAPVLSA